MRKVRTRARGAGKEKESSSGPRRREQYQSFLSVLRLSVHPSQEYRVAVNFLRGALFGCANCLPSTVLLSLLEGHFSPVINVWDEMRSHLQEDVGGH